MKKQTILLGCAILIASMSLTACSGGKRCKGGGWYGDRNLTYTPAKQPAVDLEVRPKDIPVNREKVNP